MRFLVFVILLFFINIGKAQHQVSPTVMVIPFVKEGEDMRAVYEKDSLNHLRVAMATVKNAFDSTAIKTIDLHATLKQLSTNENILPKDIIIAYSKVDIYVEVEAKIVNTSRGNSVTVILNTYDAFSGQSLSNGSENSPKFRTRKYGNLSNKALDKFLGKFINNTLTALDDLSKNGRSITVDIGISENASIDMDSEIGATGDLLSDEIEAWMEKNTKNSQFNIQGITATKMILNHVKIPKTDPETQRNYSPSKFAKGLRVFLKSKGIESSRRIQGTNIFITIE